MEVGAVIVKEYSRMRECERLWEYVYVTNVCKYLQNILAFSLWPPKNRSYSMECYDNDKWVFCVPSLSTPTLGDCVSVREKNEVRNL